MHRNERLDGHQKFKELSALAQGGMLTSDERVELERHLQLCHSCRDLYHEYSLISTEGMPQLGAYYTRSHEFDHWDDRWSNPAMRYLRPLSCGTLRNPGSPLSGWWRAWWLELPVEPTA